ncbi:MAG: YhcH/YjgK/YiaL family protein [Promethearchaeota archaeon]
MICDELARWKKYRKIAAPFSLAFEWIEANYENPPGNGTYPISDGIRAIVDRYDTRAIAGANFENHQKYMDIQYVVNGSEKLYWTPIIVAERLEEYSKESDIEFFKVNEPDKRTTSILLDESKFVILWPGEWHMPCISVGSDPTPICKFVIKIDSNLDACRG